MGEDFSLHLYLASPGAQENIGVDAELPSDIATWMPAGNDGAGAPQYPVEASIGLPGTLQPGTYDLKVAIVDRRTGLPIQLAMQGRDDQGRYQITTINVGP
jgi:hypothetical protein